MVTGDRVDRSRPRRIAAGFAILPTSRGCAFDSSTANGARARGCCSTHCSPASASNRRKSSATTAKSSLTWRRRQLADVAFGIEAAARAHQLAFVGLVTKRYYLACRRSASARIAVDTMVATARGDAYRRAIAHVGGYDCDASGDRVHLAGPLRRTAARLKRDRRRVRRDSRRVRRAHPTIRAAELQVPDDCARTEGLSRMCQA